jgi:hypothetical protein
MQDPKFEKQVQQKMEELQFAPSDVVWKKIEEGLNEKKKRRVPFFWLFLLGGLILAGGIYFASTSSGNKKIISSSEKTIADPQPENKKEATVSDNKNELKKDDHINAQKQSYTKNSTTDNNNTLAEKIKKPNAHQQQNQINQTASVQTKDVAVPSAYNRTKNEISSSKEKKQLNGSKRADADNDIAASAPDASAGETSPANNKKEIKKNESEKNKDLLNDISADSADKKKPIVANKKETKTDSSVDRKIAKSNKQNKKTASWEIGYTASPGISNISQGLFKTAYAANTANFAAALPTSPVNYYSSSPSSIDPGFSFSVGAFVAKKINKRIKLFAGLNYHYYSAHLSVGSYINAPRLIYTTAQASPSYSTAGYYQGNKNLSNYTSHYHFVELPFLVSVQINNSHSRLPITWDGGLSLSYLINSNALQYDPNSQVYYKNNALFNRTQLSASTALMLGFHVGKNQLHIGPQFQYGLSHLLNKDALNPEHLLFGGIKLVFVRSEK